MVLAYPEKGVNVPGMILHIPLHIQSIPGQKTWKDYGLDDLRKADPSLRLEAPQVYEQALTLELAILMLQGSIGIDKAVGNINITTPLETVVITNGNLLHLVEKRDNARERYANYILPTLQSPFEIWGTEYSDDKLRKRYIGLFTGDTDIAVVVKVESDGSVMWNMMNANRRRMNRFREGVLLWHK